MFKDKLQDDKIYLYKGDGRFPKDLLGISAFVMHNYSIGMHIQDCIEVNIVTKGYGMHYIGEARISANVGDVFIIPPNIRHGYMGGKGFDVAHILISDRFIKFNMEVLQKLPNFFTLFNAEPLMRVQNNSKALHLKLDDESFSKIMPTLKEMLINEKEMQLFYRNNLSECKEKSTLAHIRNIGLALHIITHLCEAYSKNEPLEGTTDSQDVNFMNAISLIHEKHTEKITLEMLAKTANLSRSAFIKRFKEVCDMTPSNYITKQRIDTAENMLVNTGYSVSDIAFKTGFYDSSHFSRAFSKIHGISPSEYRKKHENK